MKVAPTPERRGRLRLCVLGILFLGALLRISHLSDPLDYDEIWTYTFYSTQPLSVIFTDLATPNNHPFNSLMVKITTLFAGPVPLVMRLPVALAGILTLPLIGLVALYATRSIRVALWGMFALAFSVSAAQYAQCARGYEYQLFFLLLFAWAQISFSRGKKWGMWGIPLAGILAILSLPTSLLYLIPLGLFHYIPRRRNKKLFTSYAVLGLFALGYFGLNYAKFNAGRETFGIPIASASAFGEFFVSRLRELWWWPLLPLSFAGFFFLKRRRVGWCACLLVVFPLAAALLSRAGEARVYLPVVIPLSLGLAGLAARWRRGGVLLAPLIVGGYCLMLPAWTGPHWTRVFDATRTFPPETLVVYSGSNGLPILWNNGDDVLADQWQRNSIAPRERLLLQGGYVRTNGLNGINEAQSETTLEVSGETQSVLLDTMPGKIYALFALQEPPKPGDVLVFLLPPGASEQAVQRRRELVNAKKGWILLNGMFAQTLRTPAGEMRYVFLAVRAGEGEEELWRELMRGPGVFYRVLPVRNAAGDSPQERLKTVEK